jgi:RimJ/RimL family protein N-acetyltransferase
MATITLRPFGPDDPTTLAEWYEHDPDGIAAMMGVGLPDQLASTIAFNRLLQMQQEGRTIFLMADCDDRPIGCTVVTDLPPERNVGRPHIYVAPAARRHSFAVARAGEQMASELGIRHFVVTVAPENRRSILFAKRLGYFDIPQIVLRKELPVWVQISDHPHGSQPSSGSEAVSAVPSEPVPKAS